jgi:hypothetical protein
MAKIILQATAIAVVVFILATASLTLWRSFHPSSPPNEARGGQGAETKKNDGKEDKSLLDRTAEDPVAFYTLWLTLFTGILAAFTIWMALSTKDLRDFAEEQASDMKHSIEAARQAAVATEKAALATQAAAEAAAEANRFSKEVFLATERPWIAITALQIIAPLTYDPVNKALNFTIRIVLKNTGKSPARRVWISPRIYADLNPNTATDTQGTIGDQMKAGVQKFAFSLLAGETFIQDVTISIDKDQIEKAHGPADRKIISPTILGIVDYQFVFAEGHHQTGFMGWLVFDNGYLPFDSTVDGHPPIDVSRMRLNFMPEGWFAD